MGLNNFIVAEGVFVCITYCFHPHSGWFFVSRLPGAQQAKAHNKKGPIASDGPFPILPLRGNGIR